MFFRLATGSVLSCEMQAAGLKDVDEVRITTRLHYQDDASALDATFAGGPVALAYGRFGATTRQTAHAEYLASIAAYRTVDGYRIPGEFVVCAAKAA